MFVIFVIVTLEKMQWYGIGKILKNFITEIRTLVK